MYPDINIKDKTKGDLPTTVVRLYVVEDEIVDLTCLQLHRHLLQSSLSEVVECVQSSRTMCI